MLKLFIAFILFSALLESLFPLLTFIDEICTVFFMFFAFVELTKKRYKNNIIFTKLELLSISLLILVILIGILSSLSSRINTSLFLQVYTVLGVSKYILIYISVRILLFKSLSEKGIKSLGEFSLKVSIIFSISTLVLFLLDLQFNFLIGYSYRFGFKSIAYGFGHPAEFSLIIILLTTLNIYFNIILYSKISYGYIILNLFLLITSGRVTAITFYIMIILLLLSFRYFRRYVFLGALLSGATGIYFAKDKIIHTFINVEEARGILLVTGLKIAERFFPLGSGLGTFGSNASRIEYSPLYFEYGLSNYYGLTPHYNSFVTDSYWAMILGEFGFIGAFINLLGLLLLLWAIYSIKKGILGMVIAIPIFYMLIGTPVDTTIISNSSLPLMFITAFLVSIENIKNS